MINDWGDALEVGAIAGAASFIASQKTDTLNKSLQEIRDELAESNDRDRRADEDERSSIQSLLPGENSESWDLYFGQEKMKAQLRVHIDSAKKRNAALPHVLLASGMPGAGKTTMAKLVAKELDVPIKMMVPPFETRSLYDVAKSLPEHAVLFIDEIHKLADGGVKGAEVLLHLLEEKVLYLEGRTVPLADITVIGATTDADKLPETVLDRFPIKPFFEVYSVDDLVRIAARFEGELDTTNTFEVTVGIAKACRGIPRVARELVLASRDLNLALGRSCTLGELLEFKETDADGMTRAHKRYLVTLHRHFGTRTKRGLEYVAGEDTLRAMLRETRQGLRRLERFLIEQGLVELTTRGRKLTYHGEQTAQRYSEDTDE